jgi:hypothetical protein
MTTEDLIDAISVIDEKTVAASSVAYYGRKAAEGGISLRKSLITACAVLAGMAVAVAAGLALSSRLGIPADTSPVHGGVSSVPGGDARTEEISSEKGSAGAPFGNRIVKIAGCGGSGEPEFSRSESFEWDYDADGVGDMFTLESAGSGITWTRVYLNPAGSGRAPVLAFRFVGAADFGFLPEDGGAPFVFSCSHMLWTSEGIYAEKLAVLQYDGEKFFLKKAFGFKEDIYPGSVYGTEAYSLFDLSAEQAVRFAGKASAEALSKADGFRAYLNMNYTVYNEAQTAVSHRVDMMAVTGDAAKELYRYILSEDMLSDKTSINMSLPWIEISFVDEMGEASSAEYYYCGSYSVQCRAADRWLISRSPAAIKTSEVTVTLSAYVGRQIMRLCRAAGCDVDRITDMDMIIEMPDLTGTGGSEETGKPGQEETRPVSG